VAPRPPKGASQRLPPILRKIWQASIPSYSKGSRGLSVLPRVCGIFTTYTISPSPSSRQCSSRYAVHARRNLPDKELRYLRTVHFCYSRTSTPVFLVQKKTGCLCLRASRTFLPASACRHAGRTISFPINRDSAYSL
jgi:hypothetical protein